MESLKKKVMANNAASFQDRATRIAGQRNSKVTGRVP